jgi:ribosome biogenesis GTPase
MDTPGMRELEVWNEGVPVQSAFEDITEIAMQCRFRDCLHQSEPGCAVARAVAAGILNADRVANYLKLNRESSAQQIKRRDKLLCKAQKRMYQSSLWSKW